MPLSFLSFVCIKQHGIRSTFFFVNRETLHVQLLTPNMSSRTKLICILWWVGVLSTRLFCMHVYVHACVYVYYESHTHTHTHTHTRTRWSNSPYSHLYIGQLMPTSRLLYRLQHLHTNLMLHHTQFHTL